MSVIIKVDSYSFICPDEETSLLEAIESEDIEVEYQCRQGFCGACHVKLVEGKVTYFEEPLAFIPEGHILPCCCSVNGDITIELDDDNDEKSR